MLFHYRQCNINNIIPNIAIGSEPIEKVAEFNFLGLTIDENLDWNPHLQKISNKVSRTLGVICRLKNYLPVHILRLLYNSLVLPYLQYGILTWGFKIGRIEKLQKRAVRIITCSKYNVHTEPLFKTLNLLKVSDMFTLNLLKMYYKYKNQSLPFYVMNMFTDAIEPHDYNLQNKYVLQSSVARTHSGDKCVRCYLPHLRNNTDENILTKISTHSYQGFVFYVKTSILTAIQLFVPPTIVMFATDALRYYLNSCLINFICPLHDNVQFPHDSYSLSRYFDLYFKSLWAGK